MIWLTDSTNWHMISGEPRSRFVLDGVLVAGSPVNVIGPLDELTIRHSTLVPGSALRHDCEPERPNDPSLVLMKTSARVNIEQSIVGTVQIKQDEVRSDPITIRVADSILDATRVDRERLDRMQTCWPMLCSLWSGRRSSARSRSTPLNWRKTAFCWGASASVAVKSAA